jgi:hypothetical protein
MQACTRRAVAYVAGSLISGRTTGAIYNYQDKRHVGMSGVFSAGSVSVYDDEQRCHIAGSESSLYHYGNRAHITLQLNGQISQATTTTQRPTSAARSTSRASRFTIMKRKLFSITPFKRGIAARNIDH